MLPTSTPSLVQRWRNLQGRGGSPPPPQFQTDQLTLSQPWGHIMTPTFSSPLKIFRPSVIPVQEFLHLKKVRYLDNIYRLQNQEPNDSFVNATGWYWSRIGNISYRNQMLDLDIIGTRATQQCAPEKPVHIQFGKILDLKLRMWTMSNFFL